MRNTLRQLVQWVESGKKIAFCRLIETRGSTPQKAGAMMAVQPDGTQAGTLGGGCVEAEVKRKALKVLQQGAPEMIPFVLDHDFGWDDGLICGGRMNVLIEPVNLNEECLVSRYLRCLTDVVDSGLGAIEAIAFDNQTSSLPTLSTYLIGNDGKLIATLRDTTGAISGKNPPRLISDIIQTQKSRRRAYAESGVAYLPISPRCPLLIVGGGHVGQAVANLAAELDFNISVVDDRESLLTEERFPNSSRIVGEINETLKQFPICGQTYCLIVTRGHQHDQEALYRLVERGAAYVGLIGSRRKIRMIYEDLQEAGISTSSLAQVHAPVGIDIGSQTVAEIAVSITAELVAHRNIGSVPGRPAAIDI